MPLSTDRYLTQLVDDLALARDAALASPLTQVPSTPEWNALSLYGHIAQNLAYAAWLITADPRLEPAITHPALRDDYASWLQEFELWASTGADRFMTATRAAKGRKDVPNWTNSNTTPEFWARRMCHETAIHRWDVSSAVGQASPLPSDIAVDALDELVEVLLHHWMRPRRTHLVAPPLLLRATDIPLDITVSGSNEVTSAEPVTLAATASDLVLILLGRVEAAGGHEPAIVAWRELCRFAD